MQLACAGGAPREECAADDSLVRIHGIFRAFSLCFAFISAQALRLYNHFNWLPQLQERSEQLLAVVGRERRLSLSLVRQEAIAKAAREAARESTTNSVIGGRETCQAQGKARDEVGGERAEGRSGPAGLARQAWSDPSYGVILGYFRFSACCRLLGNAFIRMSVRVCVTVLGARSTCLFGSFVP